MISFMEISSNGSVSFIGEDEAWQRLFRKVKPGVLIGDGGLRGDFGRLRLFWGDGEFDPRVLIGDGGLR